MRGLKPEMMSPAVSRLCQAISRSGRYDWFVTWEERMPVVGEQAWLVVVDTEDPFDEGKTERFCLTAPIDGQWAGLIDMLGLNGLEVD